MNLKSFKQPNEHLQVLAHWYGYVPDTDMFKVPVTFFDWRDSYTIYYDLDDSQKKNKPVWKYENKWQIVLTYDNNFFIYATVDTSMRWCLLLNIDSITASTPWLSETKFELDE